MTQAQLLASCKLACRVSSVALDPEFNELIEAAFYDLEISGVADSTGKAYTVETADQLVVNAIKTFVKLNLGDLLSSNSSTGMGMWTQLEKSYEMQKATLKMRVHSDSTYEGGDES